MPQGNRLAQLAAEAAGAPTPGAALRKLTELRLELDAFERRQVSHALAEGSSFASIARDLGLSRQAVHRRFRGLASADAPLLTAPDVRLVLRLAHQEATALHAEKLRDEHIVLGVLRAGDLPAAALLRDAGASLERARAQIEASTPRAKLFQREPEPVDLRALLDAPAREARARGGRRIEVEHLLLGIMNGPDSGAVRTLRALHIDVEALRRGLLARVPATS